MLAEFASHDNGHRPHQRLQQEAPGQESPPQPAVDIITRIERKQVLGDLISTYRRAAVTQIYEGTNQIQHMVMARQLLRR